MGDPVLLRTARLVLSAPGPSDVDAIHRACQDPEVQRWTTVPAPYLREHAESFVEAVARGWADGGGCTWAIRDDDGLVGMVGLDPIADGAAVLGYWTAAGARRRGYGAEAARAVVGFGFGPLRLERIGWSAVAGNVPSARLARDLGFRFEGVRRAGLRAGRGREDAWTAGLLPTDDRTPSAWPVLD